MLYLRRDNIKVRFERREHPRIEFHCPVTLYGHDLEANILDFSLGGFFIETRVKDQIKLNKHIDLIVKLPTEDNVILLSTKVVNIQKDGIGCMFTNLSHEKFLKLDECFSLYQQMLPIA